MGNQLMHMELTVLFDHLLCHQAGITVHLHQALINIPERALVNMSTKITQSAIYLKALVNQLFFVTHMAPVKKLWLPIIWIPAAMPDPSTEKIISARDKVSIRFRPFP